MKGWKKGIGALLAAALMVGTAAGCSTSMDEYATTPALKYGDQTVYLDEANFWLRYEQWATEAQYGLMYQYYGYANMWEASIDGNKTLSQQMKEDVMAQLIQTCILNDHAEEKGISLTDEDKTKVTEQIAKFRDAFAEEFKEYSDASDESIQGWMEKNALAVKVWDAVKQETEVTVSDEESQEFTLEYVFVSNSSGTDSTESTEASDTEKLTGEALADEMEKRLNEGKKFSDFAEELGTSSSTQSYLKVDPENTSVLYQEGSTMKTGEIKKVTAETGWYVIQCTSDLDEEATEKKRAEVEDSKREEYFNSVYAEWAAAAPEYEVQKAWDDLKVDQMIYVEKPTEATTAESTSAAGDATTEAGETTEASTAAAGETTAAETTSAATTAAGQESTTAAGTSEAETTAAETTTQAETTAAN
ncbi:hypothetical protein MUB23_04490 [Cuneatibacter sp. NSJ-177]|uniref:hypothetical protein n=1 Tax=Cuneatibacter sp. NSJ-177 TaxID=2931401 RepID=UPI001FD406CB|nr:hypothetical protein [Cuneatibacter sp. NSJ-177]MCJ7834648.1 hypothetical protein [Cuneatibacter sp. NSJ-177]